MAIANKASIDTMMEYMNTILGDGDGRTSEHNKENTPPSTNTNREGKDEAKKVKHKKKLYPHCNLFVLHKPKRCYELDANKDKWWVGWKLVKEAST
jgi:hypothetical protein